MRIAMQVADLDGKRIDGTRVYILELLNRFGVLAPDEDFFLYHREEFNPELTPKKFPNYRVQSVSFPVFWTQTRFAFELFRSHPNRLWMPMQAIPFIRPSGMETIVTIHDLAFRKFPEHFPPDDLRRLTFLTNQAIKRSDRIIAVSKSTKRDILEYYPKISEEKIRVVYHGYSSQATSDNKRQGVSGEQQVKDEKGDTKYKIQDTRYLLYVGAIQPRKNLEVLVHGFEELKKDSRFEDVKLVLVGEKAWLWEGVIHAVEKSEYRKDIIVTGSVSFEERTMLYRNASVFVFPSLYEGFGLPVLEAFAQDIPVVCAKNSSLFEVGGEGAIYFEARSLWDLVEKLCRVLENETIRKECVEKGRQQLKKFSWDKCARETLEVIRGYA